MDDKSDVNCQDVTKVVTPWRVTHREKYRLYMREYMRRRREKLKQNKVEGVKDNAEL
jgi:hypothetical protein